MKFNKNYCNQNHYANRDINHSLDLPKIWMKKSEMFVTKPTKLNKKMIKKKKTKIKKEFAPDLEINLSKLFYFREAQKKI